MKDVDWSTFFRHLDRSMGIYFSDIRELNIEDDGEVVDAQYQLKDEFDCLKNRDVKDDLRLLVKIIKMDIVDKLQACDGDITILDKSEIQAYQLDPSSQSSVKESKEFEEDQAAGNKNKTDDQPSKDKIAESTGSARDQAVIPSSADAKDQSKKPLEKKEERPADSRSSLQGSLRSLWSPKLPDLRCSNWVEWSTLLEELLMTRPQALSILRGEVKEGDDDYCAAIDEDLYYLLHWKVSSSYRAKVRNVKSEVGPKGSVVYEVLRSDIVETLQERSESIFKRGEGGKYSSSMKHFYLGIKRQFDELEENGVPYSEEEKLNIFVMGLTEVKDRHKAMSMIKKDQEGTLTLKDVYEVLLEEEKELYSRKGKVEPTKCQLEKMKKGCREI